MENSIENIREFITKTLADILSIEPVKVDMNLDFDSYGLDSASAVIMLGELEDIIDMDLSPSVLYEHDSVNRLSTHVASLVLKKQENLN